MGRLKDALLVWASTPTRRELQKLALKKDEVTAKATAESAVVRMWKRNTAELEVLLNSAYEKINAQAEIINQAKQGDWQEKLIDKGLELAPLLFANMQKSNSPPKAALLIPPSNNAHASASLPTGNQTEAPLPFTDEQIKEYVDNVPEKYISPLSKLPFDKFQQVIKGKVPELTNIQILKAHEYIQDRSIQYGESRTASETISKANE